MDTKLVLVDGMPGTGKSTVSQFINLQLRENGLDSDWYHEETFHPVRLFYDAARHGSWPRYTEHVTSVWLQYTNELASLNRIAVLDAAILQNHVRSMLIFDADRTAIVDLVLNVANVISRLSPKLVYLKPESVEENFRNVVQSRGNRMLDLWVEAHDRYPYTVHSETNGYGAFIGFWKEFGQIADTIFEALSMSKLQQLASNDTWDDRFLQICQFLNLSKSRTPNVPHNFARFVGNYVPLDDDKSLGFQLRLRAGCLVALAEHPTFDPNRTPIVRFEETLLSPREDNTCLLVGWPYVVQFTEDGFESVQATVRGEYLETGDVYIRR